MADPIYLLDFRRGVVEEIVESAPPTDLPNAPLGEDSDASPPSGFVLAALGSPPEE
jgi:hypothetical protein